MSVNSKSPAGSADIALETLFAQMGAWRVLRSALWRLAAGKAPRPIQGVPAYLHRDVGLSPGEPYMPHYWRA